MKRWKGPRAPKLGAAIVLALAFGLSGCLYVKNGSTEDVRFESTPAGAQVIANGIPRGSTPTTVKMSRCEDYNVVIEKPGYKPASVLLSRTGHGPDVAAGVVDHALILPGFVDTWNCSGPSLGPNPVNVKLLPIEKNAAAPTAKK